MTDGREIFDYKHIIWDWNGTLLDDVDVCIGVINRILEKREIPKINYKIYRDIFEFPVANYYNKLGFDYNKDSFEKIADEYINDFDKRYDETKLQSGAKEILGEIKKAGISQSILSASKTQSLLNFVKYFGIDNYFINIIGLDNHYAESKIKNGQRWIKELGVNPKNVLMVGDTTHDYEVANSIGVDCILVASGHESRERLQKSGVRVCNSLNDIMGTVNKNSPDKLRFT